MWKFRFTRVIRLIVFINRAEPIPENEIYFFSQNAMGQLGGGGTHIP